MAVVRRSSSGRAVQFILGEDAPSGTVFQLSASLFGMVMSGSINGPFVRLSRLAIPADSKKFPASDVWSPDGVSVAADKGESFSKGFLDERREQSSSEKSRGFKVKW